MNQVVQRSQTPVQRFTPHSPELTGHSLNLEAQCDTPGSPAPGSLRSEKSKDLSDIPGLPGAGALETRWMTEDLIARTQEAWGDYLGREVDREEAMEILFNVQQIALAFYLAGTEGDSDE